jgi:hypothetical protein
MFPVLIVTIIVKVALVQQAAWIRMALDPIRFPDHPNPKPMQQHFRKA